MIFFIWLTNTTDDSEVTFEFMKSFSSLTSTLFSISFHYCLNSTGGDKEAFLLFPVPDEFIQDCKNQHPNTNPNMHVCSSWREEVLAYSSSWNSKFQQTTLKVKVSQFYPPLLLQDKQCFMCSALPTRLMVRSKISDIYNKWPMVCSIFREIVLCGCNRIVWMSSFKVTGIGDGLG